jgi:hypothetical protein
MRPPITGWPNSITFLTNEQIIVRSDRSRIREYERLLSDHWKEAVRISRKPLSRRSASGAPNLSLPAVARRVHDGRHDNGVESRSSGAYVEARGWTATEYVDRGISGATEQRPALARLLLEAHQRRFTLLFAARLLSASNLATRPLFGGVKRESACAQRSLDCYTSPPARGKWSGFA